MSIDIPIQHQSKILTSVVERLAVVTSLEEITQIVAEAARKLTGADGATFVLKDGNRCYYVDENAISPLWKGKRFMANTCISGWAMYHKEVVVIRDIYQDYRIPHDAYRPTFVKSLCMVPIRSEDPIGAIGNYWSEEYIPSTENIKILQILANSTSVALQNLELKQNLQMQSDANEVFKDRTQELEAAICSVAHDLRSPVAAMMGLAELLLMHLRESNDEKMKIYINTLLQTGHQASEQISKMLSLYKVTKAKIEHKPLDVSTLAKEVFKIVSPQFPRQLVEFHVEDGLGAIGDETMIRLVLENLISNALKYSSKKPKSCVHIGRTNKEGRSNTFFVKDNGEGFPPAKGHMLFRPLGRLHSDTAFNGTGMGLVSVARIIEMHGGIVKAESQHPNGATFYFSLPEQATG